MKDLSKKQIYILIFVFVVATAATLVGVFYEEDTDTELNKVNSIEWNENEVLSEDGDILFSVEDLPSSMQVSETSEFGTSGPLRSASLSPDKKWIAFSMTGAAHGSGWLYEISSKEVIPVAFQYGGGVNVLDWSPDSQYIAFNIGAPAPSEYIKVVNRSDISEFVSETGTQLRLEEGAGLTPPFSYEFMEWQAPHTICISLNESKDCFDLSSINNEEDEPEDLLPVNLEPRTVSFGEDQVDFEVDENFNIDIAAEGLGKARFIERSPDRRFFVPDMVDYELSHEGKIFILDDFNEDTHEFESKTIYLSGLRGPHDVAFYTDDEENSWIYITLTEHLIRYRYSAGDNSPQGEPEVVYEFPNSQSPNANSPVWHLTRTILFQNDRLFVSVGSGCNACEETEEDMRPFIFTMTPEGRDVEVYASGIKNAVGLEWVDGTLYATENGVDHLGDDAPDDVLYEVREGENYGWPYCYELNGSVYRDESVESDDDSVSCENVPISFADFEPHSAPLEVTYLENIHPVLNNSFLVALQGAWDKEIGAGYKLVRVSNDGETQVFMNGFLDEDGNRVGRPVDVLQKDNDSFFVTDDYNGRVYYIYNK